MQISNSEYGGISAYRTRKPVTLISVVIILLYAVTMFGLWNFEKTELLPQTNTLMRGSALEIDANDKRMRGSISQGDNRNIFSLLPPASLLEANPIEIDEDDYRTALVMPCTFLEAVTGLPMALQSVLDSQKLPAETIIVFGFDYSLEKSLDSVFPLGISPEMDNARAHLRNFVLKYVKVTRHSLKHIKESQALNKLSPDDSMTAAEYLASLHASEWLSEKTSERSDDMKWKEIPESERYIENLTKLMTDKYVRSIDDMAADIPNFKIVLNRADFPYANSNREAGTMEAFSEYLEPRKNDLISFLDCDDMAASSRVHLVEQIFKENPEIVSVIHGFKGMGIHGEYKHLELNKSLIDDTLRMVMFPLEQGIDLEEAKEKMYDKYFDFRDPKIKDKYMMQQESPEFLANAVGNPIKEPWNVNDRDGGSEAGFNWWLGISPATKLYNPKIYNGQLHNGHSNWRHAWLIENLGFLPNTRKGQDSRLNYWSRQLGGKLLVTPLPLARYTSPSGQTKRGAIAALTDFVKETHAKSLTTTTTTTSRLPADFTTTASSLRTGAKQPTSSQTEIVVQQSTPSQVVRNTPGTSKNVTQSATQPRSTNKG